VRHTSKRSGRSRAIAKTGGFADRLADEARVLRTWFDNPLVMGAVSPSGRILARVMAGFIDPYQEGPIVELGPGTGPVTEALIRRGIPAERLVLIEYDPAFCQLLARRFPGATIIRGDAYDLKASLGVLDRRPPAAIVSSLPLLTKPESQRLALLDQGFALMRPDGVFVQFTYGLLSPIPTRAASGVAAECSAPVWLNLPPARVWAYRRAGTSSPARPQPLFERLRQGTERVQGEWKERTDRVKADLICRTEKVRADLKRTGERVRIDRHVQPALALLERFGDKKRRNRGRQARRPQNPGE
jgi:phosphatidylethanolamine/phosphatidyl-N-methylethanolamine N-methyltransferase